MGLLSCVWEAETMNLWLIFLFIGIGMVIREAIDRLVEKIYEEQPKIKIKWEGKHASKEK